MPDTHVEPPPRTPYDGSMETRVARLEEDMREVKAIGGRLETGLADVRLNVAGLQQDVGGLKQDVGGLKQDVGGLKQDVAGLKQDVAGLKQDVGGLKQDVAGLQQSVGLLQQTVAGLQQGFTRLEATLTATLPHLATKAELAEKPSKAYLVGLLAVLITAYAAGLAALAVLK